MDISKLVLTDAAVNAIDNGAWVGDLPGAEGVELFVCGMKSKPARDLLMKKQAALRQKNKGKPLSEEQNAQAVQEVLAEVVLKDWRGFTNGGKSLKYDKDQARHWIMSRNGEALTELVLTAASRLDKDADSYVAEVVKNS